MSEAYETVMRMWSETMDEALARLKDAECPRCREYSAIPFGEPGERAAWKALGRSFAVHTCDIGGSR